jgi:hypothetical protein
VEDIIEHTANGILEYIEQSNHVGMLQGLRESITESVSRAMVVNSSTQPYRHDKKRKYEEPNLNIPVFRALDKLLTLESNPITPQRTVGPSCPGLS